MNKTIQLYIDEENDIKGYPITSFDRVINEHGNNLQEELDKNTIKFDIVGEGIEAPPINGGDSYDDSELVKRIDSIDKQINNIQYKQKLNRHFKIPVGVSPMYYSSSASGMIHKDQDFINMDCKRISRLNIDTAQFIAHIQIVDNNLQVLETLDNFSYSLDKFKEYGIQMNAVKFHFAYDPIDIEKYGRSK